MVNIHFNCLQESKIYSKKDLIENHPWAKIHTWDYIFTGYRKPCPSILKCFGSLFFLHNEFMNAWTHLIGIIWSLFLLIFSLFEFNDDLGQQIVFGMYGIIFVISFSVSTSYHLLCCHSEKVCKRVQCMDWMVISTLIFASNLLGSYNELKFNMYLFWTFTCCNFFCMILSSSITYTSLQMLYENVQYESQMHKREKEKNIFLAFIDSYAFRTFVYMTYALGLFISWVMHFLWTGEQSESVYGIIGMYLCYLSVILCLNNWPEKYLPVGTVDIFGASHMWFHIGSIAGFTMLWKTYYEINFQN